jgi:hypothetical protein
MNHLPDELIYKIIEYTDEIDWIELECTNKRFHTLIRNNHHNNLTYLNPNYTCQSISHPNLKCSCSSTLWLDTIRPLTCPDCKQIVLRKEMTNKWGYCDECLVTMIDTLVFF